MPAKKRQSFTTKSGATVYHNTKPKAREYFADPTKGVRKGRTRRNPDRDSARTATTLHEITDEKAMERWYKNPGGSDIRGVDDRPAADRPASKPDLFQRQNHTGTVAEMKLISSIGEARTMLNNSKMPAGQRERIEAQLAENEAKLVAIQSGEVAAEDNQAARAAQAKIKSEGAEPIVPAMLKAVKESTTALRGEMSNVRYGPIEGNTGTFLFDFRGETYKAPDQGDYMLGSGAEADQSIALRAMLSGEATKVSEDRSQARFDSYSTPMPKIPKISEVSTRTMKARAVNDELDKIEKSQAALDKWFVSVGRGSETNKTLEAKDDPAAVASTDLTARSLQLHLEIKGRYGPGAPTRFPTWKLRDFKPRA